jgi:hypothetical protein
VGAILGNDNGITTKRRISIPSGAPTSPNKEAETDEKTPPSILSYPLLKQDCSSSEFITSLDCEYCIAEKLSREKDTNVKNEMLSSSIKY